MCYLNNEIAWQLENTNPFDKVNNEQFTRQNTYCPYWKTIEELDFKCYQTWEEEENKFEELVESTSTRIMLGDILREFDGDVTELEAPIEEFDACLIYDEQLAEAKKRIEQMMQATFRSTPF